MSTDQLTDKITGSDLSDTDLKWIESRIPAVKEPFARLLILILLLQVRVLRTAFRQSKKTKPQPATSHPNKR